MLVTGKNPGSNARYFKRTPVLRAARKLPLNAMNRPPKLQPLNIQAKLEATEEASKLEAVSSIEHFNSSWSSLLRNYSRLASHFAKRRNFSQATLDPFLNITTNLDQGCVQHKPSKKKVRESFDSKVVRQALVKPKRLKIMCLGSSAEVSGELTPWTPHTEDAPNFT